MSLPTGWSSPLRKAFEELNAPVDYPRLRMHIKCDFLALTYLLKNAANLSQRYSREGIDEDPKSAILLSCVGVDNFGRHTGSFRSARLLASALVSVGSSST